VRVAVTGGAGFIGSKLVRRLTELGYEVVVVDDLSKGSLDGIKDLIDSGFVTLNRHDIRVLDGLREMLKGCDALFHLAAVSTVPEAEADISKAFTVNVVGTANLMKVSTEMGLARIIFASSAAVYGDQSKAVTESDQASPTNVYGMTKLLAERLVESYSRPSGISAVVLRIFNVYGGGWGMGVVDSFLNSCINNKPLRIYGDGRYVRDFIHLDDVVEAFLRALEFTGRGRGFERFNIATGRPITVLELANMMLKAFGKPSDRIRYEGERSGDIRYSLADITHARDVLGFSASISIEDWIRLKAKGGR
jgi:UDP-glucose 4-epimerase